MIGRVERNARGDTDRDEDAPHRMLSKQELETEAEDRLEQIHQYLSDRYARREVVARTTTKGGIELDWVPVESQLRDGRLADRPDEDRPVERSEDALPTEPVRFELEDEPDRGPDGTVPLVRKPIEQIRPVVRLNDWLAKGGRAHRLTPDEDPQEVALPEDAGTHKYAVSAQDITCYGTEGKINAWDPYVEWSDEFSLGQLSLSRGSGSAKQTVEVGHQEYPDHYGDWVPHLMLFYTTNGYTTQGDKLGGYNTDVDGWVQVSDTIYPGATSSSGGGLSQWDGPQYVISLKVQLYDKAWWVRVGGAWIGYYPADLFSSGGLQSQASSVKWFGEIVDGLGDPLAGLIGSVSGPGGGVNRELGTTRTDMGNGHWPYEGWEHCAFMSNLRYQSSPDGTMTAYQGATWATHPVCYGASKLFTGGLKQELRHPGFPYFWWGGPGMNERCMNPQEALAAGLQFHGIVP